MFIKDSGNSGNWKVRWMAKKASTAFSQNAFVVKTSGQPTIEPATSASTALRGIIGIAVTSADSDYASASLVPVFVPVDEGAVFIGDTVTAITSSDLYKTMDLSDSLLVNPAATSTNVVTLLSLITSTKGRFVITTGKLQA